jgi:hypothetical protein
MSFELSTDGMLVVMMGHEIVILRNSASRREPSGGAFVNMSLTSRFIEGRRGLSFLKILNF